MNTSRSEQSGKRKKLLTLGAAALVVVPLLFYALENWRGSRAWDDYRRGAAERGQILEVPAPPQALTTAPQRLDTAYQKELTEADSIFQKAQGILQRETPLPPGRGLEGLNAWGQALAWVKSGEKNDDFRFDGGNTNTEATARAAATVIECFAEYNALFDKLRSACQPPDLLYPFGYDPSPPLGSIPRIFSAIQACQRLKLKASAQLALHKNAEAFRELELMIRLSESLARNPYLISAIGRVVCRTTAVGPFHEALTRRQLTESELQQLQSLLSSVHLVADLPRVFTFERGMTLRLVDWLSEERRWDEIFGSQPYSTIFRLIPPGWIQLEKVNYSKAMDQILAAGFPDSRKRIVPDAFDIACDDVSKQFTIPVEFGAVLNHKALGGVLMPKLKDVALNFTVAQVTTNQIRVRCGLERYYLKHGRYPETLAEIVPEFLAQMPIDPLSGEVYRYSRQQDGRWKLWSVGWNGKDDGGVSGGERFGRTEGDWVGPAQVCD